MTLHFASRTLCISVLMCLTLTPLSGVHAEKPSSTEEGELRAQLTAIHTHLERYYTAVPNTPIPQEELRDIVTHATEWLIGTQESSGHFSYEYAPYEDALIQGDNLVRQTGALYQLGELARFGYRNREHRTAVQKAIEYFENLSATETRDGTEIRCIAYTEEHESCPLGATSLALAGILGYLEQYPEDEARYRGLVNGYVAYILHAQKETGGFRNVHRIGSAFQPEKESSFSNGEALMALTRYSSHTDDVAVQESINRAFLYLKEQPFDGPLYLWILAAIKELHSKNPDPSYVAYAREYTRWRVDGVSRYRGTHKNYCAYSEGIASAYSILKDAIPTHELQALRREINLWNRKNSFLQIREQDRYRVSEQSGSLTLMELPRPEKAIGGFLTSNDVPTERIDFTQHCISAYLQTLIEIEGGTL